MSGLDRDALVSWFSRHSVEDMKKIQDRSVVTSRETREALHSGEKVHAARLETFLEAPKGEQLKFFGEMYSLAAQCQAAKLSAERLREELAVMTENYEGQKMINKTLVEVA